MLVRCQVSFGNVFVVGFMGDYMNSFDVLVKVRAITYDFLKKL